MQLYQPWFFTIESSSSKDSPGHAFDDNIMEKVCKIWSIFDMILHCINCHILYVLRWWAICSCKQSLLFEKKELFTFQIWIHKKSITCNSAAAYLWITGNSWAIVLNWPIHIFNLTICLVYYWPRSVYSRLLVTSLNQFSAETSAKSK